MTDKKDDLTRLENIAAFLHEEDSAVDDFFAKQNEKSEPPLAEEIKAEDPPPFGEELPSAPDNSFTDFNSTANTEINEELAPPTFDAQEDTTPPSFGEESPTFGSDESPNFETSNDFSAETTTFEEMPAVPDDNQESNDEKSQESDEFSVSDEVESSNSEDVNFLNDSPSSNIAKLPIDKMVNETYQDQIDENKFEVASEEKPKIESLNPVLQDKPSEPSSSEFSPKENFKEIKEFATHLSYGDVTLGGNPPFSIVLKNIQYIEDADDILMILKEHGIVKDENEESYRKSLQRGILLVSHISEYSAIFLCHKLRRFNLDVLMGLSDEIHPPKTNEETPNKGLINKKGIKQNYNDNFKIDHEKLDLQKMIVTTTNLIESHEIKRYIGVASEHLILASDSFIPDSEKNQQEDKNLLSSTLRRIRKVKDLTKEMGLEVQEKKPTVKELYDQLTEKLKIQVLKMGGNSLVGVQYQMISLTNSEYPMDVKYKLTCTGTVVWASRT
jgi:uncharacterized protein YbjQ (UPF0145 family)